MLAAAALVRLMPAYDASVVERALNSRWAPPLVGALSGVLLLWMWGSLARTPVIDDESAYLLQAELFARWRWTGVAPPIAAFFEQPHVLIDGVLASKYPPGNSIILALGALVGLPGLAVILANACSGALMFALARRAAGGVVALLTWIAWESSFPMDYYHANYMSESVSSLAWLLTWWAIVRWHTDAERKWLLVAAGAIAWCMITRPLTGVALGIVASIVILVRCKRTRAWRDLLPAAAVAATILAIIPLWSWRTTGDVRVTPLTAYTKTYLPFDTPGFGASPDERPSDRLPPDQQRLETAFYGYHVRHTLAALPRIAWLRLTMLDRDEWYEWRGGLRLFALVGLIALTAEGWIVLAAFATQFVLYLAYAHPAWWTMYYVECMPVLAFLIALGIVRALALLDAPRRTTAGLAVAAVGLVAVGAVARQVRATIGDDHAYYDAFARLLTQLPDERAVVFVRYGPKHLDGMSLVRNVADLDRERVWSVYDRGADDARLIAAAPGRTPYLFDEQSWTLRPLP